MSGRFAGKTVRVTGATGGFGSLAAKMFAAEGASLVLSDHPSRDVAGFAASLGTPARGLPGDVSDPALHAELVACAVSEFGGLDVAVNNAGIVHARARLEDVSPEDAARVINIDLMGVWHAMRAQIPAMDTRKGGRGGAIVNVASLAGIAGAPQLGVYAAAKHGVVGLTKTAAAENARRGIRCNAICPAYARTPMVEFDIDNVVAEKGMDREAAAAWIARGVPMRRLGAPEEIAQAIVWAASPENGFMTGQTIAIDGGVMSV
ncbi:MAG: SDR family NAD(P)-dependent oxidoreductase [Pseudomonadota bacterium]|nr:SDR family NAD(P)-dependent oxidoreductase [Pseudomonadota bacterium]